MGELRAFTVPDIIDSSSAFGYDCLPAGSSPLWFNVYKNQFAANLCKQALSLSASWMLFTGNLRGLSRLGDLITHFSLLAGSNARMGIQLLTNLLDVSNLPSSSQILLCDRRLFGA